jgi:hypothetical protein
MASRTGPSDPAPQNRCASRDQPDGGEIREYLTARNVVAESLDGLMAGLKLAPDAAAASAPIVKRPRQKAAKADLDGNSVKFGDRGESVSERSPDNRSKK